MSVSVDLIFKIAAIGIITAVLTQVLSRVGRDEQAMMVTLAALAITLLLVINEIKSLFDTVKSTFGM
ncbi:MAG TPA: stage III sporulation protein AC [Candidatus Acidoferrum sp.]|nr:stage III sporulation protein AC [Candidatus Acidoferrum sp.]